MSLIDLFQSFQTQEQALEYLETVRWRGHPVCPYCNDERVYRHASGDRAEQRWQCQHCHRAFSVTVKTIFHGTHVPLKNWFLVIALMLNVKKSASAYQIAKDIGMRRPTVGGMMHRVRMAIAEDPDQKTLLHSLVEVDEAYLGSRPRKENERDDDNPEKPGRGRRKGAVVSIAEHSRRPIARVAKKRGSSTKRLFKLVAKIPAPMSHLAADQFGGRRLIARLMSFVVINIGSHLLIGALTYKSSRDSGLW